ncbi:hypothetical protein MTsPCn9_03390 [Croceitalea sp. MTPC9]|uniref:DUF6263 family protein n=1 Tax=unclassified Croceitalea TaxID=2632280 RepID=UPI002B3966B4|nr:hypothetical protein MTsPCn6_05320 [Croceitalea sp. MTPC6]GMN15403.1 hypothetical protein MTsPCn9_03390 [Croceitalea sp. MTPC9]
MKSTRIIILLISFLATFSIQAQNTLKYDLKEGALFKVKQQAKQLITQQLEGTKHEMTNDLTGLYDFKVTGVDDKGYDLVLIFQDFALKSNSSIQGVLMDVKAKELVEGDIMSEMFHSLIGHELQMRMNTNGSVVSVEGGDELITKMISSAGIEDEFTMNLMRKSLEKEFSSDGLAKSFEQMTYFYPNEAVAIGDSWENTYSGKLSANNTFKLEKVEGNTTSISGTAAVIMNTEESGTTMSLSGSQETVIQTNTTNGFIKKVMVSSLAEGSTKMAQMGNVEIPTTIESTTTYELLEN